MMDFSKLDLILDAKEAKESLVTQLIVRLKTYYWHDKRGLHIKKDIIPLKKKSQGCNFFEEDVSNIGAYEVLTKITNLNECEDGIYEVITCNFLRDWETGNIEDYDYRLIPYKEEDK